MEFVLVMGVVLVVLVGFTLLAAWLFLRPAGVLERLYVHRDQEVKSLHGTITDLSGMVQRLELTTQTLEGVMDTKISLLNTRMSSFESRYGKQSKKEEQKRLQEQIWSSVRGDVAEVQPAPRDPHTPDMFNSK